MIVGAVEWKIKFDPHYQTALSRGWQSEYYCRAWLQEAIELVRAQLSYTDILADHQTSIESSKRPVGLLSAVWHMMQAWIPSSKSAGNNSHFDTVDNATEAAAHVRFALLSQNSHSRRDRAAGRWFPATGGANKNNSIRSLSNRNWN